VTELGGESGQAHTRGRGLGTRSIGDGSGVGCRVTSHNDLPICTVDPADLGGIEGLSVVPVPHPDRFAAADGRAMPLLPNGAIAPAVSDALGARARSPLREAPSRPSSLTIAGVAARDLDSFGGPA
jgi:hypothetical protein